MIEELRTRAWEGDLSNKIDVDEVYRELCAHYKESIVKMKAFTDSQQAINENGLLKLSIHLGLKMEVDSLHDKFKVWYNPDFVKEKEIKDAPPKKYFVKKEKSVEPEIVEEPKTKKVEIEDEDDDLF